MKCIVCGNEVDWEVVKEEFKEVFENADMNGMHTIKESEQVIFDGKLCSTDCDERR